MVTRAGCAIARGGHYDPPVTADRLSSPGGALPRTAVVVSRYNPSITDRLLEGALGEFARRGGALDDVTIYEAPGAFEVPAIAASAARSGRFAAIVALACIIRGRTRHDRYLAQSVTDALMSVAVHAGVAVGLGVLTVETSRQAFERAGGGKGNKGADAMAAALDAARTIAASGRGERAGAASIAPRVDKAEAPGGRRG